MSKTKSQLFIFTLVCLILFSSCREKTAEDKTSRTPVLSKTHKYESEGELAAEIGREKGDSISVIPVQHASFLMELNGKTLYVDPIGEAVDYEGYEKPDLVLITDIHADHFLPKTLTAITDTTTILIMPEAVYKESPKSLQEQAQVIENGEQTEYSGIAITAVPMYNLRAEAQQFHPKGRGNGYLLEANGQRIYISGDTEDIPEMRALTDIDLAFVCMNLPYTMKIDQAVDAVLDFKPRKVYPYHYRGDEGLSDVDRFKSEVEERDTAITVQLLDWYPDE